MKGSIEFKNSLLSPNDFQFTEDEDERITRIKNFILFAKKHNFEYLPVESLDRIINNEGALT